jgi:hypothetical protein
MRVKRKKLKKLWGLKRISTCRDGANSTRYKVEVQFSSVQFSSVQHAMSRAQRRSLGRSSSGRRGGGRGSGSRSGSCRGSRGGSLFLGQPGLHGRARALNSKWRSGEKTKYCCAARTSLADRPWRESEAGRAAATVRRCGQRHGGGLMSFAVAQHCADGGCRSLPM